MKGTLQLVATFLFLHQVRLASLLSLPEGVNPVKVEALKPDTHPPQPPPLSTIIYPKPYNAESCTKKVVHMRVKKDGCRSATLRTKECVGLTYSYQAYTGFNSTVYQENVHSVCAPVQSAVRKFVLKFYNCKGREKPLREKVYLVEPRKCGAVVQDKERLPVLPPHPATLPPFISTTDC